MSTHEEAMFREALSAVRSGERARARNLLTRLLKLRQDQVEVWLWMSAVVETQRERAFCLKEVLRIDPDNAAARRGLALLDLAPPNMAQALSGRAQKLDWQRSLELPDSARLPAHGVTPRQLGLIGAAAVIVLAITLMVILGFQQTVLRRRAARPIIILPTQTVVMGAASTPTAEITPRVTTRTPTRTPATLADLLPAPYTPTPLYVNTPHVASESFRIGMRAFQQAEWAKAEEYFLQAAQIEPGAPDVQFYLGETARFAGDLAEAERRYNDAIKADQNFAPAYWGRAVVLQKRQPDRLEEIEKDLEMAVRLDPDMLEGTLALAEFYLRAGSARRAMPLLDQAEGLAPYSALVWLLRAESSLTLEETEQALDYARRANMLDMTLLPPYRMIGEILQVQNLMKESLVPLQTYVTYARDDAHAWRMLGKAQAATGQTRAARDSLDRALQLDPRNFDARLLRGMLRLETGDPEGALEDYQEVQRLDAESFEASMGMAQALMALKYPGDAYDRVERAKKLARTPEQKAEWQYRRALALQALGELDLALRDFQAVAAMPDEAVPAVWRADAARRAAALEKTATPTRTLVRTLAPTLTRTLQPTRTFTPIPTRTRLPSATPKN